jgi:hypothetical protein
VGTTFVATVVEHNLNVQYSGSCPIRIYIIFKNDVDKTHPNMEEARIFLILGTPVNSKLKGLPDLLSPAASSHPLQNNNLIF